MGGAALTETVLASPTVDMQTLQSALDRCAARTVAQRVWSRARLQLPDALAQLLRAALMLAHAPLTVPRLANACGWHERTLRKQCDRQRLPAPQWIIGWARLLIAAYYLDEPGHSMESVADLLQFPSLAAFRNQLRRYTGLSPSEIRGSGAIQTLRLALERETVGDAIASMDRDAA
jgi:AraC-like DNA-binding protein